MTGHASAGRTRLHPGRSLAPDHVRDGFARLDAGEIDAFDLDDLIHHYKRAAQKLWSFCTGSAEHVAGTLAWMREQDDETDWWKVSQPLRRS